MHLLKMTSNGKGEWVEDNMNVKWNTKNLICFWYKPKAKGVIKTDPMKSTNKGAVIIKGTLTQNGRSSYMFSFV